jgi:hypothetical protein
MGVVNGRRRRLDGGSSTAAVVVEGAAPAVEAFDPSAHNVADVLAYLSANPDDAERVLDAERAGKARKGVLEG